MMKLTPARERAKLLLFIFVSMIILSIAPTVTYAISGESAAPVLDNQANADELAKELTTQQIGGLETGAVESYWNNLRSEYGGFSQSSIFQVSWR